MRTILYVRIKMVSAIVWAIYILNATVDAAMHHLCLHEPSGLFTEQLAKLGQVTFNWLGKWQTELNRLESIWDMNPRARAYFEAIKRDIYGDSSSGF